MAQRYGGAHSPGGKSGDGAFRGQMPRRMGARLNIMMAAPFVLLFRAFSADPVGLALYLGAFGLLLLAAWLTREGIRAEDAYNARAIARRPAMPRKMAGSVLTGLGLALAGFAPEANVLTAGIFGVLGAGLHFAAFGPDPLSDKGADGVDKFQSDRVARVVDEAEKYLADMQSAIDGLRDRRLAERVRDFQVSARDMIRTVENDPRDLTAARRYLGVYLMGARDASLKFAELYARGADASARADYEALLDDLEQSFSARTQKMLLGDRTDLDVEIGVLRERLERDGIRPDR